MSIVFKTDVLQLLKAAGYTTTRLRKEKIMGEATIQQLRTNQLVSWATINKLCLLLDCQPGDLVEYISDEES